MWNKKILECICFSCIITNAESKEKQGIQIGKSI